MALYKDCKMGPKVQKATVFPSVCFVVSVTVFRAPGATRQSAEGGRVNSSPRSSLTPASLLHRFQNPSVRQKSSEFSRKKHVQLLEGTAQRAGYEYSS